MDDRSFLAAIVDSSDDAIIGKDLEGRILSWNRGAERLYGYCASEMVGTAITRLVPEECENDVPAILAKIRRDEQVAHHETKRQRVDGAILDVSLTVSPVRGSRGEVVAAATIARDITTRSDSRGSSLSSFTTTTSTGSRSIQATWTPRSHTKP